MISFSKKNTAALAVLSSVVLPAALAGEIQRVNFYKDPHCHGTPLFDGSDAIQIDEPYPGCRGVELDTYFKGHDVPSNGAG